MALDKPIARGNTADIYLHEGKAVKVFHDRLPDSEAEWEAGKQRIAYALGLPVPEVFAVAPVNGRQAIFMEYVAGIPFGDLMQQDGAQAEAYLALSVDMQRAIHARPGTGLESMRDKLARQLRRAGGLSEESRESLLSRLAGMPVESRVCHGDYHIFNLIRSEGRDVIIDWMDASAGSPSADVYRTYLLYSQHASVATADAYLRLYCQRSGLPREAIFAWAPIVAGARLSEHVSAESAERLLEIVHRHS